MLPRVFDRHAFDAHAFAVGELISDSSLIENALIALLGSDAQLLALMPNGVYYELAAQGSTRYVTVTLDDQADVAVFGGRGQEIARYRVQAVGVSTAQPDMRAAALRIDQLLEDKPLLVDGYAWATMHRVQRLRTSRPDATNPSVRWFSRGGLYRVVMTPTIGGGR